MIQRPILPFQLLLAFALSLLFATPAKAQECSGLLNSFKKQVSSIYDGLTADSSPFNYACQDPKAIVGRPPTPFYSRAIPQRDSKGRTSRQFLSVVAQKIRRKIQENRNMMANLKTCVRSTAPACRDANIWVKQTLPEYVREARFNLSIAQSPYQVKTWLGYTSTNPNSGMSNLGSPKMVAWDRLTKQELLTAEKSLAFYESAIQQTQPPIKIWTRAGMVESSSEQREALLAKRHEHFEKYQAMIANVPLLQYLHSESVGVPEVLAGVSQMEKALGAEEAALRKMEAALKENPLGSGALALLEYSTLVEEALLEKPQFCGLAASLQYSANHRGAQNALAIALPILAVSIVAPPLAVAAGSSAFVGGMAATGVGVASGVGFAMQSQKDLTAERNRSFSQFYGNIDDLNQVGRLERARNFQMISLPLAFGGAGAAAQALGITKRAATLAGRVKTVTRLVKPLR